MRRKDRETTKEFALSVVDACEYATLSTVGAEAEPYCVPLSIVRDGGHIYFHCAHEGQKITNMKSNPKVCIACVGSTRVPEGKFTLEYESAVVFGAASEVLEENEKVHALRLLCLRYAPGNMDDFDKAVAGSLGRTAVWRVEIGRVTGKRKKYN